MQLKFLGTGSGKTSLSRFHSSLLFSADKNILIDAGDGISKALLKQNILWNDIDAIILTHYHADHLAGLPSLLTQMIIDRREKPLKIYTHSNLVKTLSSFLQASFLFPQSFDFELSIIGFNFNSEISVSSNFTFKAEQNSHITNKHNIQNVNFISSSFLFSVNGKNIFYTSDIGSSNDFSLFKNEKIDCFITETTHITLDDIKNFVLRKNFKSVILTHISDSDIEILTKFVNMLNNSYNLNVILAEDGLDFPL